VARIRVDIAFAIVDIFVVIASYTLGLGLRTLDPLVGDSAGLWANLWLAMPVIILFHLAANVIAGAYGHVWEHASTSEAIRVVAANGSATAVLCGLSWLVRPATGIVTEGILVPFYVVVTGGLLSLLGMGLMRFRSRLFSFHRASGAIKVLVVGTGREAAAFSRAAPTLDGGRIVVGFLADANTPTNGERKLAGLEVLGHVNDIAKVVDAYQVDEVVVIGGDTTRARRVVDLCLSVDARLRILPGAEDIMRGGTTAVDVRDIRVEDILVRPPVETDLSAVGDLLRDKRILVTGAGGSIGAEIVRQVMSFQPASVCALDRDETLLHDASLRWPGRANIQLGDVRDAGRMIRLFEDSHPDIVFHAAALKHVPMLEDHPEEAVLTNVVGTRNVIEAGSRTGVDHFVLISTDKAVDPTSVMGATKRVAEIMIQVGPERGDDCVYTAVRFGNVLGSRGSVIPTFIEQIKSGGPVTVTDAEMTRYFMTVDEAVQLVLQASTLATGSEVFLLDMGEPVRIDDLARRLIRLAGLTPGQDIEIRYTGRRPGEKLVEILSNLPLEPTANDKIYDVHLNHPGASTLMDTVAEMEAAARAGHSARVMSLLGDLAGGRLTSTPTVDLTEGAAAVSWS
jgi:FlaA1/EpsC-like NDP-sugar epimerase